MERYIHNGGCFMNRDARGSLKKIILLFICCKTHWLHPSYMDTAAFSFSLRSALRIFNAVAEQIVRQQRVTLIKTIS